MPETELTRHKKIGRKEPGESTQARVVGNQEDRGRACGGQLASRCPQAPTPGAPPLCRGSAGAPAPGRTANHAPRPSAAAGVKNQVIKPSVGHVASTLVFSTRCLLSQEKRETDRHGGRRSPFSRQEAAIPGRAPGQERGHQKADARGRCRSSPRQGPRP